jgi:hypothetical protein
MGRRAACPASLHPAEESPDFTIRAPIRAQIRAQRRPTTGLHQPWLPLGRRSLTATVARNLSGQFDSETARGFTPAARHFHEKRIDAK